MSNKDRPGCITAAKLIFQITGWSGVVLFGVFIIIAFIAIASSGGTGYVLNTTVIIYLLFIGWYGFLIAVGNAIGKGSMWSRVMGIIIGILWCISIFFSLGIPVNIPGLSSEIIEFLRFVPILNSILGLTVVICLLVKPASLWFSGRVAKEASERKPQSSAAVERICLQCGRVMDVDWKACPHCGWVPGERVRVESDTKTHRDVLLPEPKITVPNLIGIYKDAAIEKLAQMGLKYEIEFTDGEKDMVYAQSIKAGQVVDRWTVVELSVGEGYPEPQRVEVPDVVSLEWEKAVTALKCRGLNAELVGERYSVKHNSGEIVAQQPACGNVCDLGRTVSLFVSLGMDPNCLSIQRTVRLVLFMLVALIILTATGVSSQYVNIATGVSSQYGNLVVLLLVMPLEIILGFYLKGLLKGVILPLIIVGIIFIPYAIFEAKFVWSGYHGSEILLALLPVALSLVLSYNSYLLLGWINAGSFIRLSCFILFCLIFIGANLMHFHRSYIYVFSYVHGVSYYLGCLVSLYAHLKVAFRKWK